MCRQQIKYILLLCACLCGFVAKGQFVSTSISAQDLIERYFANYGIQVSNIKFNGKQSDSIIGLFDGFGVTNLGLNKGIVLSTARLKTNQIADSMKKENWPSDASGSNLYDADLDNILKISASVKDACVIEFDFVASSNLISFNYVFASTEYIDPYSVCAGFHDEAAFFLSGYDPKSNIYVENQNIALVPETNIPVGVNSIHYFPDLSGGDGQCYLNQFSQYYVNNAHGTSITFPGFTKVLKAQAQVKACEKYHLKFAIANVGDRQKQSMVFLEAGSLVAEPIRVFSTYEALSPKSYPMAVSDCKDIKVKVTLPISPIDTVFLPIEFSGEAQNGIDCEKLPDTLCFLPNQSVYEFTIKALHTNKAEPLDLFISVPQYICSRYTDRKEVFKAALLSYEKISVTMPADTSLCQSYQLSNALRIQPVVSGGLAPFNYVWQTNAKVDSATILSPLLYPFLEQENVFQLTIDDATRCGAVQKNITVKALELPILSVESNDKKYPIESCTPYMANFKVNCSPAANYLNVCAKHHQKEDMFCSTHVEGLNGLSSGNYDLLLKATTREGCTDSIAFSNLIRIYESPQAIISPDKILEYPNKPFALRNVGNTNTQTQSEWLVTIDKNGSTNLHEGDLVELAYEQTGNFRAILKTWNTYLTIKSSLVCSNSDTVDMIIFKDDVYFPNVITANGDGINDYFQIKNLEESNNYQSNELSIFDRWGKKVFYAKPYLNDWGAENVPTGTYFYQFKAQGYTKNLEIQGAIEVVR